VIGTHFVGFALTGWSSAQRAMLNQIEFADAVHHAVLQATYMETKENSKHIEP